MKIADIITLGKMGYTRRDIDEITAAESQEQETESGELATKLAKLEETVDNALKSMQVQKARSTVTLDSNDPEDNLSKVQESLKMLMMGASDGESNQQNA